MKVEVYNTINKEILKGWETLWRKSRNATVFNSPWWFMAFIRAFQSKDLKIIVFYSKNKFVAVVPIIKVRMYGVNVFRIPGDNFSHDIGFLADFKDNTLIKQIVSKLENFGIVLIKNVAWRDAGSLIASGKIIELINTADVLDIDLLKDSNGEFILSKKTQIIKKAKNELNNLTLRTYSKNFKEPLNIVFNIDNVSTKHKNNYNVFHDDRLKKFYLYLTNYRPENININILYRKRLPVAYEIGFINNNTYIDSERAYLEGHEYYTPGKVMLVKLAELLAEHNYSDLDLGPGVDNFKKSLATKSHKLADLLICKNAFFRFYLRLMIPLREKTYELVFNHRGFYSILKKTMSIYKVSKAAL